MAVAPLIAMKSTKCESLEAVARELDRRAHTYVNDVDPARSGLNEVLCCERDGKPLTLDEAVERRVGELHTKRAVRKDAVKAMGFIVSTNDALSDERASEFLHEAAGWFAKRYGKENMLGAAIHYDEDTPHLHLWLAPVISEDGWDRLCAAKLFTPDKRERFDEEGNKLEKGQRPARGKVVWKVTERGTMSVLQEDFWREVASKYGYDRPLDREKRGKGYRSLEAYKTHVGTTRALRQEAKKAREDATQATAAKDEAERKAGEAQEAAKKAKNNLEKLEGDATFIDPKTNEKRVGIKGVKRELADLTAQRDDLKQEVTNLTTRRSEVEQALNAADTRLGQVQSRLQAIEGDKEFNDQGRMRMGLRMAERILRAAERARDTALEALADATRGLWDMLRPLVVNIAVIAVEQLVRERRQPTRENIEYECDRAFDEVVHGWGHDEQEMER